MTLWIYLKEGVACCGTVSRQTINKIDHFTEKLFLFPFDFFLT